MTITAKMKWMLDTIIDGVSVKDRWLIPHNGVYLGTLYADQPVGNSTEFMSWYDSLKQDVKRSHNYHYVVTDKSVNYT